MPLKRKSLIDCMPVFKKRNKSSNSLVPCALPEASAAMQVPPAIYRIGSRALTRIFAIPTIIGSLG